MVVLKVLFIVAVSLPWSLSKLDKYCAICADHTMCKYHGIGPDCDDIGGFGVTPQERQEILDVHNWCRRIIASGSEKRGTSGPQPKAANMNKLVWDEDLAIVAQRWADQCLFQHDTCRHDRRWRVGQNIYWAWKYPVHKVNWTEAIISWYNEVALFDASKVQSYRFDAPTGHYTQLVWHDTSFVGCGRRDYGPNKLYICNYGPTGNWLNEPMYTIGEPCSKCSHGMFCNDYLCAKPEMKPVDQNIIRNSPTLTESPTTQLLEPSTDHSLVEVKEVDNLNPSNSNKKHGTDEEVEETTISKPVDNTKPGSKRHPISDHQLTPNSIENSYPLDAETKSGIEEIKLKIEKLVRKVIRKVTEKH